MKSLILVILILLPSIILAQVPGGTPSSSTVVNSGGAFNWFASHWGVVASVLLGISESLALLFPAQSGFGGILASVVGVLKQIGTKPPQDPQ